jgi:hypothetical protein
MKIQVKQPAVTRTPASSAAEDIPQEASKQREVRTISLGIGFRRNNLKSTGQCLAHNVTHTFRFAYMHSPNPSQLHVCLVQNDMGPMENYRNNT